VIGFRQSMGMAAWPEKSGFSGSALLNHENDPYARLIMGRSANK
jgi:hypothetical protein